MKIDALKLVTHLGRLQDEINNRPYGLDKLGSLETLRDVLIIVEELTQEEHDS